MVFKLFILSLFAALACCHGNVNTSAMSPSQGFRIIGDISNDFFGGMVGNFGDINGDGLADMVSCSNVGVYVFYGAKTQDFSDIEIGSMTNSQGFSITGAGNSPIAAGLGDINGDGLDDFAVGYENYNYGDGGVNIILGSKQGFSDMSFGGQGFTFTITDATAGLGGVGGIGDINGDGLADFALAASGYGSMYYSTPTIYIIFGNSLDNLSQINLTRLSSEQGFKIILPSTAGGMSKAGDINADGLDDMIISIWDELAYVIYGTNGTFPYEFDLGSFSNSSLGFIVTAASKYIRTIAGVGDVNGDGIDDIVCGDGSNIMVLFGRNEEFPLTVNISSLTSSQGATIAPYLFTYCVSELGDVNGDNINDFLIGGSPVSVIYGSENGFPSDVSSITPSQGYQISGGSFETQFGSSVSGAGDINGDGVPDIIIGASGDFLIENIIVGIDYVVISTSGNSGYGTLSAAFMPLFAIIYFLLYI